MNYIPNYNVEIIKRIRAGALGAFSKDGQQAVKSLDDKNLNLFQILIDMNSNDKKNRTHEICKEITSSGIISIQELKESPLKFLAKISSLSILDLNVMARLIIHFQLFGGTILELGTEYHRKLYQDDINSMKIIGGFAMTEMGHGSNVRNIETLAVYDLATQEFVITSPTPSSTKFWIGNVARHGTHVVLFARLIFKGEDKGVHGIVVNIRDMETGKVREGIELGDVGPKIGWNGIDNAWIRFNGLRVPRLNLLSRFASITESGEYISKIQSPGKLFQITISQLVFGRMLYICGPIYALNQCIRTTYRYALQRKQFGAKGKEEETIINYPTHYQTLIPMIAKLFAVEFARNEIIDRLPEAKNLDTSDAYNSIVGGVKALVTDFCMTTISKLRVMCGGNGIHANSLLGYFRDEFEVFLTAEGDGTVLYQQLSKFLLVEYKKWYKKEGVKGYIMKEVQSFLDTSNPYYTHSRSIPYLLSDDFHVHAFNFRFEKLRSIVIDNLSALKSKGLSFQDSWNSSLIDVIKLSKAYTELFCLESSYTWIKKCTDPSSRAVLGDVIKLYALSSIEADFSFYRNTNFISAGKAYAITEAIKDLCLILKPFILDLLEESYPFSFINTPISSNDYVKSMSEAVGIPYKISKL